MWTPAQVPSAHQAIARAARQRWPAVVHDSTPVWPVSVRGREALLALGDTALLYVAGRRGNDFRFPYASTTMGRRGAEVLIENPEWRVAVETLDSEAAAELETAFGARQDSHGRPARASSTSARPAADQVLIVTTNDVPGHEIIAVHGDVFGLIVRARNAFANMGASIQGLVGGEVSGYTRMLSDSRNDARERLAAEALRRGANAVVAMRFDCNELADVMSEVAAYGTAVTIAPVGASAGDSVGQRWPAPADNGRHGRPSA